MKKSLYDVGKRLSKEEYASLLEWRNNNRELAWSKGDCRESDGRIFWACSIKSINGEVWVTRENFERMQRERKNTDKNKLTSKPLEERKLTDDEWAEMCKFREENPHLNLKQGDIREDGMIFYGYDRKSSGGKRWIHPDKFEEKIGFKRGVAARPEQMSFLTTNKPPTKEEWEQLRSWRQLNPDKVWHKWNINPLNENLIFMGYQIEHINGEIWSRNKTKDNLCNFKKQEILRRKIPLETNKISYFQLNRKITSEEYSDLRQWIKENPDKKWDKMEPHPVYENLVFHRYGREGINGEFWISPEVMQRQVERAKLPKKPSVRTESTKERVRAYVKERRKSDPKFKLAQATSTLIRMAFSYKKFKKNTKSQTILGCNMDEFREHLKSQFLPWMNLENQGRYYTGMSSNQVWQIDHIIPISFAETETEVILLNHYLNLRPICALENITKGNTLPPPETIEKILNSILEAKQKKIISDLYETYSQITELTVKQNN